MAGLKSMDEVLQQLKSYNDQKMDELLQKFNEVRAEKKLARAAAKAEEVLEKVEEVVESTPAKASMDKWMKLLDELGKK